MATEKGVVNSKYKKRLQVVNAAIQPPLNPIPKAFAKPPSHLIKKRLWLSELPLGGAGGFGEVGLLLRWNPGLL